MKTRHKSRWLWMAAVIGALGWAGRVEAANPAYLNINVTITANLSVAVNESQTSTQTAAWNAATANAKLVSPSSATVSNDSGGQTERWALSTNAGSINTMGGTDNWTLAASSTSVGGDAYAVQAVFGSSNTIASGCPITTSGDWDSSFAPLLTTGAATYTNTRFADTSLNASGGTQNPDVPGNGRMRSNSKRALCWRVISPDSTSTSDTQNIQVIITAQAP